MTAKLTAEQRAELLLCGLPAPIEDEESRKVYFIIDEATMERLRRQEDLQAIRDGIADMEAGRVSPLDEAFERIRNSLGLPER